MIIIIIIFIETRSQDTIGKLIKYICLGEQGGGSSLVTFESCPQGSMANRAGKNSKISMRTRLGNLYTSIVNL